MRINRSNDGFTLIELLVVIAIIGLLSSVVLANLSSARAKSRDTKRALDIRGVMSALELYYSDNGTYPLQAGSESSFFEYGSLYPLIKKYANTLPTDPLGNNWNSYRYIKGNGTNSYAIRVRFETIHKNGILFGSEDYGTGWCLTGVNVYYGWWSGNDIWLPQCSTIPSI